MYADDTVLFTSNLNFDRAVDNLQEDIRSLNTWCQNNAIMANMDKTKVMVFGSPKVFSNVSEPNIVLDNVPLEVVSGYKYLGISLDCQLSYNVHVNKLIGSVSAKLK